MNNSTSTYPNVEDFKVEEILLTIVINSEYHLL